MKAIIPSIATALVALSQRTLAHSWVERMDAIAANGTFTGQPGYPRGFVPRTQAGFSDNDMVHLLPPNGRPEGTQILASDPLCRPEQQHQNQTNGFPRFNAAPGSMVALRYQENGHVTLPQNQPGKPLNRGTIYVYATTQPKIDETLLSVHKVWNANGTGGDQRGRLISTQNFDDGRCYQINGEAISKQRQAQFKHTATQLMGADLWCQSDITLPTDMKGTVTLYWVWDWPTASGVDPNLPKGKAEIYTTCMDVDVSGTTQSTKEVVNFAQSQDINFAAIPSELGHPFNAGTGGSAGSTGSAAPPTGASSETSSVVPGIVTVTKTVPLPQATTPTPLTLSVVTVTVTTTVEKPAPTAAPQDCATPNRSSTQYPKEHDGGKRDSRYAKPRSAKFRRFSFWMV
jgi:hypothetical protein